MVFIAKELALKLKHLTIWGQDEYGDIEWIGNREAWKAVGIKQGGDQDDYDGRLDYTTGNEDYNLANQY